MIIEEEHEDQSYLSLDLLWFTGFNIILLNSLKKTESQRGMKKKKNFLLAIANIWREMTSTEYCKLNQCVCCNSKEPRSWFKWTVLCVCV